MNYKTVLCKITSMSSIEKEFGYNKHDNKHDSKHDNKHNVLGRLPEHPFDYMFLLHQLRDFRSPRDKISRMIRKKEIVQVKRGLYVLSPGFGVPVDRKVLANLIYGPSYISLEYALSYWGLIPERVEEITSVTTKRNKLFNTPFGAFSYKYLDTPKYSLGILRIAGEYGGFLIATGEKALCDRIALIKNLETSDMEECLEYDLRIDIDELAEFDMELVKDIERVYKNKSVTSFLNWLTSNRN